MALIPPASWIGLSNDEINVFIREGNKAILDDMIGKVRALNDREAMHGPLNATDAFIWDAQALSDEQRVIQPYYVGLSAESKAILQSNLEFFYDFKGDVMNEADRWVFGMGRMGHVVTKEDKPEPTNEKR